MASVLKRIVVQSGGKGILAFTLIVLAIIIYSMIRVFVFTSSEEVAEVVSNNYRTGNRNPDLKRVISGPGSNNEPAKVEKPKPVEKPKEKVEPKPPPPPPEPPKKKPTTTAKPTTTEPVPTTTPKPTTPKPTTPEPTTPKPTTPKPTTPKPTETPEPEPTEQSKSEPTTESGRVPETIKATNVDDDEIEEGDVKEVPEETPEPEPTEQSKTEPTTDDDEIEEDDVNDVPEETAATAPEEPQDRPMESAQAEQPKQQQTQTDNLQAEKAPVIPEVHIPAATDNTVIQNDEGLIHEKLGADGLPMAAENKVPLQASDAQKIVAGLQKTGNTLLDQFISKADQPKNAGVMKSWVHLDLQGAPPSVDYLVELVPILKKAGATGVLIEYEDMFPFTGTLGTIRSPNAYTANDLHRFLETLKDQQIEVVPFIPTLGHMEYVLRYASYQHLREDPRYPAFLNPAKPDSLVLIKNIINSIMAFHKDSKYIHIGCDDVFVLGTSTESKLKMEQGNYGVRQLFLEHVKTVVKMINDEYPGVQPLMWDDSFRTMTSEQLKTSNIASFIQPVIWSYVKTVENEINEDIWAKYASVFPDIWVATAFKGASGAVQHLPELAIHLQNHANWLEVIRAMTAKYPMKVRGFVLTGWSRYDHFSALCDLLPASLPSLVACLQIIKSGSWNSQVIQSVSELLQCTGSVFALNSDKLQFEYAFHVPTEAELIDPKSKMQCSFPGDHIFYIILYYHQALEQFERYFDPITGETRGHCNRFSLGHGFMNPFGAETVCSNAAEKISAAFKFVNDYVPSTFEKIYDDSVASEWLEEHVIVFATWLEQYNTNVKTAASKTAVWGERPGNILDKSKTAAALP